jgi:CheY-like chemotaxis protein
MAHILVADYDPPMRSLLQAVFENEEHWVTCVDNPWQLLSAMRGTLHPMVVLFYHRMLFDSRDADEFPFTIKLREEADLRRHRLIEMSAGERERPAEVQAFYDRLGVQQVSMPFALDPLLELVNSLAEELEPTP